MSIKEQISKLFTPSKRSVSVTYGSSAVSASNEFGVAVNNDSALKLTAFNAGIRIYSENVASLPKSVKKYTKSGLVDYSKHPAYKVINVRPNSYTNVYNFWKTIITWIKGWGNAYALIKRDNIGNPVELHQIHPSCVSITLVNGKKWYKVQMGETAMKFLDGTYSDDNMLHFFEMSLNGLIGVNPVTYNAISLGKSLATEHFAAEYYRKGGNIKAVMETDGHLGDDDYEAFMAHMAASGNFDTPLLEYGIKYKQLSISPVAAQLLQSEVMSIEDVARILNIPPHMLAELSHATFSNIEHQTIQFVQYSLRPIIKNIEEELESKLLFENEHDRFAIKFSLEGLLRGDTSARSSYYHNAILDGYMSRNEVRELEGLEHKDGLDDMLYPLNTGIVGKEIQNNNE